MTLLTAALLTLVFEFRSNTEDTFIAETHHSAILNDAFLVDADSTTLIFLASWMSSLAPLLTVFAVTLATYPVAQELLEDTRSQSRKKLPTPYQLSLALSIMNGSTWTGLWNFVLYRLGWKQRASRRSSMLDSVAAVAFVALLLGGLVFGADTWLHVTTSTIRLTRTTHVAVDEALYSFNLIPDCTVTNNSLAALNDTQTSCTLTPLLSSDPDLDTFVFTDSVTTLEVLGNQSQDVSVTYKTNDALAYLSVAPSSIDPTLDFTASTFAVRTLCSPMSRECNLNMTVQNITFSCNNRSFTDLHGDLAYRGLQRQAFSRANMSTRGIPGKFYGLHNPFYVAAATYNAISSKPVTSIAEDPEVVARMSTLASVLFCDVTLLEGEYDVVKGEVTRFTTTVSNTTVLNAFTSALVASSFGTSSMAADMDRAANVATDAQDLANRFARSLSKVILSSGAASIQRTPVLELRRRSETLAAKVPKKPLFVLISANFGFVIVGTILTAVAIATPREGREVQCRLTISGLVANLYGRDRARRQADVIENLFGDYQGAKSHIKVGFDRTSKGGIVFSSVLPVSDTRTPQGGESAADCRSRFPSLLPYPFNSSSIWASRDELAARDRRSWI